MNSKRIRHAPALGCLVLFLSLSAHATLTIPSIFSDGAVLQRDKPLPIWGWADPGATVTVRFADQNISAAADAAGRWEVMFAAMPASLQGRTLEISTGSESQTIKNVLVGEVWLLGGQSNMGWNLKQCSNGETAIQRASYPWLRFFNQLPNEGASETPQRDVKRGRWQFCTPATAPNISGIGFFFAEALHPTLGEQVPVALIQTPMGGTPIQSWIELPLLEALPAHKHGLQFFRDGVAKYLQNKAELETAKATWQQQVEAAKATGQTAPAMPFEREPEGLKPHILPSALFNGKVYPLQPFPLRGVVWYQGESNAADTTTATQYTELLELLIGSWRRGFRDPDLPFIVVQLPGFSSAAKERAGDWPTLRASQAAAVARTPHTGLVVTIDLGEKENIHPNDKQSVGERAALVARALAYDDQKVVFEGPRFLQATRFGSDLRLQFAATGSLATTDQAAPQGFEMAGPDGNFAPVKARLQGNSIFIGAPSKLAATVRYAWKNWPEANVRDSSGLPLAPFLTVIAP